MKRKLIGQNEAVAAICGSIRRARVETRGETKPIGCFLFVGPTGVGKTEMAKVIAKEYFGSEIAMVRLDTRKFMENHTVSRLVNQMVEEVRLKPHCLVLFDEIEKAHEEALNVVLQIINGGRLSDGEGNSVDFRDTIVIVISNSESHAHKAEVVNGFDRFVVFKPLEKEHIEKILEITIEEFCARVLARNKVRVEVSTRLKEWLLMVGYNKRYGARALKRTFADSIETKLADEILCGRVAEGDTVKLEVTLVGDVECHISRVKINQTVLPKETTTTKDGGAYFYPHITTELELIVRSFKYSDWILNFL